MTSVGHEAVAHEGQIPHLPGEPVHGDEQALQQREGLGGQPGIHTSTGSVSPMPPWVNASLG